MQNYVKVVSVSLILLKHNTSVDSLYLQRVGSKIRDRSGGGWGAIPQI